MVQGSLDEDEVVFFEYNLAVGFEKGKVSESQLQL